MQTSQTSDHPMFPSLAGRLFTTAPSGKSNICLIEGLRNYNDLTYVDSCKNQRFWHQEVASSQNPSAFSIKEAWILTRQDGALACSSATSSEFSLSR